MKFLADEGIDKPIVDALRQAGFDVFYILETNPGADDELILSIANAQQRILLTQDKDFGELVYRLRSSHSGVILIRLAGISPEIKAEIVSTMLLKHQSELPNAFTVIQPNAMRIRK
jgi:predicted nuclease of predicted toxin-antitoxin system